MGIDKNKIGKQWNRNTTAIQSKTFRYNTIICPGRISEEKGSVDLIEAFNLEKNLTYYFWDRTLVRKTKK